MKALTIYRRLFGLARPYWSHIIGLFALTMIAVPVTLLTPLPLKLAVDSAVGSQPLPAILDGVGRLFGDPPWRGALALAVILLVLVTLLNQVASTSRALLNTWVANKVVLHFRSELFRQVQRLSLSYHDSRGTGDTLFRIQYDATAIQYIVVDGVIPFFVSAATVVSMLYVSVRIDRDLALVALTVAPILAILIFYYQPRLRLLAKDVRRLESTAMTVVQETLGAVRVVKTFGQEDRERSRFDRQSGHGLDAKLRLSRMERTMGVLVGLVIATGTALVLYVGVTHVRAGSLSLGNLLLIMGYLGSLYSPLRTVSSHVAKLQQHLTSAERALEILDHTPDVAEKENALPLARSRGAIVFEHVTFAYETSAAVFRDVSFIIPAGARVGIVGATGAGKTTLINLILRLYDPTSGRILLDGTDLRDYRVSDLRSQFSVVMQDPVLFSSSISENIAYARPDASEEDIVAAARAANAHEFILALPEGYDTRVGERGMRLSGGERQRISLARAFLRDAPLLVLDEPTSSVDTATETEIIEGMQRLMAGRTTFMVAHRLSTLDSCDMIATVSDDAVRLTLKEQGAPFEPPLRVTAS